MKLDDKTQDEFILLFCSIVSDIKKYDELLKGAKIPKWYIKAKIEVLSIMKDLHIGGARS